MLPYLIPIAICLFGVFRYDINDRSDFRSNLIWFFLFIYLTLLIGLRYKIGGDSLVYEEYFNDVYDIQRWRFNLLDFYQPGFSFMVALSKYIYPRFYSFQLIQALIVNILLFVFINRYTKFKFIALAIILYMVYLYFMTEILREIFAIMIFCMIYPLYRGKHWFLYIIGTLIACLFHFSAIILLILPFLKNIKFNYMYLLYIVVTIIGTIFFKKIISFIGEGMITDKAEGNAHSFVGYSMTIATIMKGVVFPLIFACFVKYGSRYKLKFENIIAIMILFGIASIFYPLIFGRTLNYFYLFLAISFADYIGFALKSKSKKSFINMNILLILFLICYMSSYLVLGGWYKHWIPYKSVI